MCPLPCVWSFFPSTVHWAGGWEDSAWGEATLGCIGQLDVFLNHINEYVTKSFNIYPVIVIKYYATIMISRYLYYGFRCKIPYIQG